MAASDRGLLTPCAACGDAVSRQGTVCPSCGHANARVMRRSLPIAGAALAVGIARTAARRARPVP